MGFGIWKKFFGTHHEGNNTPDMVPSHPKSEVRAIYGSLLLLDVVGLEIICQKYDAKLLAENLTIFEKQLKNFLKSNGAICSSDLAYGLMAFFPDDGAARDHSDKALETAIKIQTANVEVLREKSKSRPLALVLRAAIHTDHFVVITSQDNGFASASFLGPGLKIAQALTKSTDLSAVVCSADTMRACQKQELLNKFNIEKKIQVGGKSGLLPAWEHDPLDDAAREDIISLLRKIDERKRQDERIQFVRDGSITFLSDKGSVVPVNFSRAGLGVLLKDNHGIGSYLTLAFRTANGIAEKKMAKIGVLNLTCEVRWTKQEGELFFHGLMYSELNNEAKELLMTCFNPFATQDPAKKHRID